MAKAVIEVHQLLVRFVAVVPSLRTRLVETAEDWLDDDGRIIFFVVMSQLVDVFSEQLASGDYSCGDGLFQVVEEVLLNGSQAAKDVVATGFLEGMQHQKRVPGPLWVPLLGAEGRTYCRAWDKFTGTETEGLDAS